MCVEFYLKLSVMLSHLQLVHSLICTDADFLWQISFLDYLCYVPLFLSMHENIVDNPLDMRDDKYDRMLRKPSGGHRQRDMNPLGIVSLSQTTYTNLL